MILIHIRPGLILARAELPEHDDDPDVAAILDEQYPRLFDAEPYVEASRANDEPYTEMS